MAKQPLKIVFTARAVVASSLPFVAQDRAYADADVARDEIQSLSNPVEPTVLRVRATGGEKSERAAVAGDWLCDTVGDEPRRIQKPQWSINEAARRWAAKRTWLTAWETCEKAHWMLHALARASVDRAVLVRAACACARTVLDVVPPGEDRARRAIETAEAWSRGEASAREARIASNAAYEAAYEDREEGPQESRIYNALLAARYAASSTYTFGYGASDLSDVAVHAGYEDDAAMRSLADLVRREVPTLLVLRAVTEPPRT